jgi:hypothetical protein
MKVKTHICIENKYCICSVQAIEPDENCPIHSAGEWPPRCAECGKFMKFPRLDVDPSRINGK